MCTTNAGKPSTFETVDGEAQKKEVMEGMNVTAVTLSD